MSALPVADSNEWLGAPLQERAQVLALASSRPTGADPASDIESAHRLSLAQQGFLELRLDAALGRLAAMETLLDAERLHVRQAQAALAVAERALIRHRETIVASDQHRQDVATETGRLKQLLNQAAIDKVGREQQIATLAAALAEREAEIRRLSEEGAAAQANLRQARTQHGASADSLHRECLRLEEALQSERRDNQLLQRALDLARANRRALQDQLRFSPAAGPVSGLCLSPRASLVAIEASAPACADGRFAREIDMPSPSTLGQDGPMQPSSPALTEHLHAACN